MLFENTAQLADRRRHATRTATSSSACAASLSIYRCDDMIVRGNYVHTEIPSFRWSQVHTLAVVAAVPDLVVEHNVLRHGQWVVRGLAGRVPLQPRARRRRPQLHHRPDGRHAHPPQHLRPLLHRRPEPQLVASRVIYKGDDIQIYNNTFDGGGKDLARPWHVPAIEVGPDAFLASLRNNVFVDHPTNCLQRHGDDPPRLQREEDRRPARPARLRRLQPVLQPGRGGDAATTP